jgi:transposase-like protein
LRRIEETMGERWVFVDHATVHRGALKILPVLALVFRRRKRPVGGSWRMDETYVKVCSQWKYLYRAVDRDGRNSAAKRQQWRGFLRKSKLRRSSR